MRRVELDEEGGEDGLDEDGLDDDDLDDMIMQIAPYGRGVMVEAELVKKERKDGGGFTRVLVLYCCQESWSGVEIHGAAVSVGLRCYSSADVWHRRAERVSSDAADHIEK